MVYYTFAGSISGENLSDLCFGSYGHVNSVTDMHLRIGPPFGIQSPIETLTQLGKLSVQP